jgi:hypothetical protein
MLESARFYIVVPDYDECGKCEPDFRELTDEVIALTWMDIILLPCSADTLQLAAE